MSCCFSLSFPSNARALITALFPLPLPIVGRIFSCPMNGRCYIFIQNSPQQLEWQELEDSDNGSLILEIAGKGGMSMTKSSLQPRLA